MINHTPVAIKVRPILSVQGSSQLQGISRCYLPQHPQRIQLPGTRMPPFPPRNPPPSPHTFPHPHPQVLDRQGMQGMAEFANEVRLARSLHHPHIVRLLGFTGEREAGSGTGGAGGAGAGGGSGGGATQCLVYELLTNGNLEERLLKKVGLLEVESLVGVAGKVGGAGAGAPRVGGAPRCEHPAAWEHGGLGRCRGHCRGTHANRQSWH